MMMHKKLLKAGVFDSGIGGLTVAKSLIDHHIFDKIIYLGDTARVPYGTKDENTITRYSLEALEFFNNFDIDILITACNSVSAYAIEELRNKANYPIEGVIEAGVKACANKMKDKNSSILVTGTKATVKSGKYKRLLNTIGYQNVTSKACSLFIPIVEEGIFEGDILSSSCDLYFNDIKSPDAIILGCTHFPLISDQISNYFPTSTLIHSGEAIVELLKSKHDLKEDHTRDTDIEFFATDNVSYLKEIAKKWL
jgi:glutamate racemase